MRFRTTVTGESMKERLRANNIGVRLLHKKRLPIAGEPFKALQVLQLADILGSRTFGAADNIKADPITLCQ
jgi:hypothetical protein